MSANRSPIEPDHSESPGTRPDNSSNAISPLEGEVGIPSVVQPSGVTVSRKGIVAVALLALSLVAVSTISIQRALSNGKKDDDTSKRTGDRPTAAAGDPRRLDMTLPLVASAPSGRVIPAIVPTPEEMRAEPIGVRRTEPQRMSPEDAPVLLVTSRPGGTARAGDGTSIRPNDTASSDGMSASDDALAGTRRNLELYQRQLQGLLNSLTKQQPLLPNGGLPNGGLPIAPAEPPSSAPISGLFGGELEKSATPRVAAGLLGNRSLTLPKGTAFTCALKTKLISAASGFVGCQVQRNVFSDDGRVLLIERGSHLDGEYRIASVRPGTVRIPVLWTRLRTPLGVTVDIESPGTGPLGESGVDGYVDNRWPERIGAAMLLSLIDDSVKLVIQNQGNDHAGDTVILPSTTSNTSKLAEKVLDSTINIPPLIYQNQGGIVGIYVARDVDFSSVYELKALAR
jgi:type IV secretion system protein VirB10